MKLLTFGVIIMALMFVSSCNTMNLPQDGQIDESADPGFSQSPLEREQSPEVDTEMLSLLVQGNTDFALAFYEQVKTENSNLIFSPFSISLALSMTMAGAESSTEMAMLQGLQMEISETQVHKANNALLAAIEMSQENINDDKEGTKFQLNIANSIWTQQDFDIKQTFLDKLALHYGAGIYAVNFSGAPETAREDINNWVEQETEEKIQNLIPKGAIHPLTRLVLANAIYFNGSWMHPFNQSATSDELFTLLDGTEVNVKMMKLFEERLFYFQDDNFQAVTLPYLSSDFVMTLLVPEAGAFQQFETDLSGNMLRDTISNMKPERVDLLMPKFDFETTVNANDALKNLGMDEAFDPAVSDFSGIADVEDLHISDVLHKATITVDEEGTEAAAATAVIVGVTSAPPEEPIHLKIDRPFIFVIRHQPTGSILFMGRVVNP